MPRYRRWYWFCINIHSGLVTYITLFQDHVSRPTAATKIYKTRCTCMCINVQRPVLFMSIIYSRYNKNIVENNLSMAHYSGLLGTFDYLCIV